MVVSGEFITVSIFPGAQLREVNSSLKARFGVSTKSANAMLRRSIFFSQRTMKCSSGRP